MQSSEVSQKRNFCSIILNYYLVLLMICALALFYLLCNHLFTGRSTITSRKQLLQQIIRDRKMENNGYSEGVFFFVFGVSVIYFQDLPFSLLHYYGYQI